MSLKSTISFYATYLATRWNAGGLIRKGKVSMLGLKAVYGRYFTQDYVTKVWNVYYIPTYYKYNLTDMVRSEMFKLFPEVKTVIYSYAKPSAFSQKNSVFVTETEQAIESAHAVEEAYNELDDKSKLFGKKIKGPDSRTLVLNKTLVNKLKEEADRLGNIKQDLDNGHCGFDVTYFVQASARTFEELKNYEKALLGLLASADTQVGIAPVDKGIFTYLQNYAPGTYQKPGFGRQFPTMFMTDEHLTAFLPCTSTGLMNKVGLPIGLDADSKLPDTLDFFSSLNGCMMLITGKSGSGKTVCCYELAMLLLHHGWHGFVVDVKGKEWREIFPFVTKYKEFVLSDYNGFFTNTMRLDDIPCTKENCGELYDNALQCTVNVFAIKTALQEMEGNQEDLVAILRTAVERVFRNVKRDDPSTFEQTKNFQFSMVLDAVKELTNSKSYSENQVAICRLIFQRCNKFFQQVTALQEITLGDVLNTPFIVFSLEKNVTASKSSSESIFLTMMQALMVKKQAFRKQQGKFTFVFYEEVQRCKENKYLVQQINDGVTGARSFNTIVGVLTNSVKAIMDSAFAPMASNFAIKIIGKVESQDEKILCDSFGCKEEQEEIHRLIEQPVKYLYNFVCVYDTGTTSGSFTFKCSVPEKLLTILKKKKKEQEREENNGFG